MNIASKLLLATSAMAMLAGPALAQDNPWQVRGRLIHVAPDESGKLSAGGAPLGGGVDIKTQTVPELDISYFLSPNVSLELILGVTPHDVTATNVSAVGGANVNLGDVTLLPPTLTLQYHFNEGGAFRPYVGAGLNYTLFFNEDQGPVADSIDYDPSFGGALQVGFDYFIDGSNTGWFYNVDIKKIWINTDVTVDFTTALGATVNADVDINPLVIGVGFGYKY
jgi:outer membrane protein